MEKSNAGARENHACAPFGLAHSLLFSWTWGRNPAVAGLRLHGYAVEDPSFRGGMEVRVGHSTSEALFNHVYFTYAFQALVELEQKERLVTRRE